MSGVVRWWVSSIETKSTWEELALILAEYKLLKVALGALLSVKSTSFVSLLLDPKGTLKYKAS